MRNDLGEAITDSTILSGQELMARLDPTNPQNAQDIADIEAMLDATGATLDDLTLLSALAPDGTTFVGAIRIEGADQQVVRSLYADSIQFDLEQPRREETELGGKPVILLFDDASPDQPPFVVYASEDTVWFLSGSQDDAATVLGTLP